MAQFFTNIIVKKPQLTEFKKDIVWLPVPENIKILQNIRLDDCIYNILPRKAIEVDRRQLWLTMVLGKIAALQLSLLYEFLSVEANLPQMPQEIAFSSH